MQPINPAYKELMTNCLMACNYNRRRAVDMFCGQSIFNKHDPATIRRAAGEVYKTLLSEMDNVTELGEMAVELVQNLRVAAAETMTTGIEKGNWGPFMDVARLQVKLIEADRSKIQSVTNTLMLGQVHDDRFKTIEGLVRGGAETRTEKLIEDRAGGVGHVLGALQEYGARPPARDVQAALKTSLNHEGHRTDDVDLWGESVGQDGN